MIVRNAPQPSTTLLGRRDYPLSDEAPWIQDEPIQIPRVTPEEAKDSLIYILGNYSERIMESMEV